MQIWYDRFISELKVKLTSFSFNTYYVGVSGGRDSVFLFHVLKRLIPANQLIVLHLNHGLRGIASDQDQAFVENLAKENKVLCISAKVKIDALPSGGGLENMARLARYHWFKEKMKESSSLLFCGHSLDDHLETILMKIHRGSGLTGLKGMAYFQNIFGLFLCRPLLSIERQQITQYLSENKFPWCDDQSNLSLEYFRNEIRINTMPQIKKDTKISLIKLSVLSNQLQSFFVLPDALKINNGLEFDFASISNLSNFEFRNLIEKIYHHFDLPSGPSKKHMDRMASFLSKNATHIELSNFIHLYRWQDTVFFNNENTPNKLEPLAFVSLEPNSVTENNNQLNFQLPNEILGQVTWRFADPNEESWKGRPLAKIIKKMKIPPWRKSLLPVCEWQGELIFVSYFGITENYHKLISGTTDLVTIEVYGKKIKL